MIKYLKMSFKSNSSLKVDLIGFTIVSLVFFIFRYIYFGVFFQEVNNIAGFTEQFIYLLFTLSLLMSLISSSFISSINKYFEDVHQGKIEAYLVKPIPQYQVLLFRALNIGSLYLFFVFITVFFIYLFLFKEISISIAGLLGSFILFLLGVFVNIAFVILFESLTFLTSRHMPVEYIHSELNRLNQIPFSLYGIKSISVLMGLIPLVLSCSIVVDYLMNGIGVYTIIYFLISILHIFAAFFIFNKLQQSFDTHGG